MEDLEDKIARCRAVDVVLKDWRQGDCVLGEQWFVHRFEPADAITESSIETSKIDATVSLTEAPVRGLVVLTQTCDLVRKSEERPYVVVAPLVEVTESDAREIARGYRPKYAVVPALQSERLVADLDRMMTVEKAVLAKCDREPGCKSDADARVFAEALKRNRGRFAFPDDFVEDVVVQLHKRLRDKHDKNSEEGRALRALREIRVTAAPSWEAEHVTLMFWFIREKDQPDFESKAWRTWLEAWLKLVRKTEHYTAVEGIVTTLADMTAEDYVTSDPLDLDHLSLRGKPVE